MTLSACSLFIREQLDGLASPYLPPLKAYVMPPAVGDTADNPEAFIWPMRQDGRRLTITRALYSPDLQMVAGSGGNRRAEYEFAVWVASSVAPDHANADEAFPVLLHQILKKLWAVPVVAVIHDPTTQEESGILDLGERWSLEYPPPQTVTEQRYVIHHALLTLKVIENFQG